MTDSIDEKATKWLESQKDVKMAAKNRLLAEDLSLTLHLDPIEHYDEQPEDVLITLLKYQALPGEKRQAIIGACKEIYDLLMRHKAPATNSTQSKKDLFWICEGLCHLVEATAPSELQGHTYSFLTRVFYDSSMPQSLFITPAVNAVLAYNPTKDRIPFLEQVLKTLPFSKIDAHLKQLRQKQASEQHLEQTYSGVCSLIEYNIKA
jgi:hypothetical protein